MLCDLHIEYARRWSDYNFLSNPIVGQSAVFAHPHTRWCKTSFNLVVSTWLMSNSSSLLWRNLIALSTNVDWFGLVRTKRIVSWSRLNVLRVFIFNNTYNLPHNGSLLGILEPSMDGQCHLRDGLCWLDSKIRLNICYIWRTLLILDGT